MDTEMRSWVCKYNVVRHRSGIPFDTFDVEDSIWSTTMPNASSVGHYWRKHAEYCRYSVEVTVYSVCPGPVLVDAQITNHRSFSGRPFALAHYEVR